MRFAIGRCGMVGEWCTTWQHKVVGEGSGSLRGWAMEGLVCLLTPTPQHGVALFLALALQEANVYMIDEPSSYLDVRQRLKAAKVRLLRVRSGTTAWLANLHGWEGVQWQGYASSTAMHMS